MERKNVTPAISVVFVVLNEEDHLPLALSCAKDWASEIIVVDMYSDDSTAKVAQQFGAEVLYHKRSPICEDARDYAVQRASGDWVLILDADELVPEPLSRKLLAAVSSGAAESYEIPRNTYINGVPMRFMGWGPQQEKNIRLFKKGSVRLDRVIHYGICPQPGARLMALSYEKDMAIQHFSYVDISQLYDKLNRYTSVEAQQAYDRNETFSLLKAVLRSLREFASRYFKSQGFRDGWRGFQLSVFYMIYRWTVYAKLQELYATGGREKIIEKYRDTANAIIAQYDRGSD